MVIIYRMKKGLKSGNTINIIDYKKAGAKGNEELYSNAVRAGKRTYFFDIRETRSNDQYLTITESKKVFDDEGNFRYEKHKIFLYKEDFEKFGDALNEAFAVVSKIQENNTTSNPTQTQSESDFTDVDFDSLGN